MRKLVFVVLLVLVFLFTGIPTSLAGDSHNRHKCQHKCSSGKTLPAKVCNRLDKKIIVQVVASDGSHVAAAVVYPQNCNRMEIPRSGNNIVSKKGTARLGAGIYTVLVKKVMHPHRYDEGRYEQIINKKITITKEMVGCKRGHIGQEEVIEFVISE